MKWNPFSRKPKPLNPGPIIEDWAVGDLAECVIKGDGSNWRRDATNAKVVGPAFGDVLRVQAVSVRPYRQVAPQWSLIVSGYADAWIPAFCFRKVPPLNSKATAEFTAQIKAIKPKERARRMAATARRAA